MLADSRSWELIEIQSVGVADCAYGRGTIDEGKTEEGKTSESPWHKATVDKLTRMRGPEGAPYKSSGDTLQRGRRLV